MAEIIELLEVRCQECSGLGMAYGETCADCEGTGTILTTLGAVILAFVRKHIGGA